VLNIFLVVNNLNIFALNNKHYKVLVLVLRNRMSINWKNFNSWNAVA